MKNAATRSIMKQSGAGKRQSSRTWLVLVCILVLIVLVCIAIMLYRSRAAQPVEEPGSITIILCPACEDAFLGLLRGGGDIECALYDFGPTTEAALRAAKARVVTDDEDGGSYGQKIAQAGLMHDKFCVINKSIVMSGSYNPTEDGERNQNNMLIIESQTLAENYHQEFLAIAAGRNHRSIRHTVIVNGTRIENFFCPQDACEAQVQRTLAVAKHEIVFFTYTLTSDPLIRTLQDRRRAGVTVAGVCDGGQWNVQGGDCAAIGALSWDLPGLLHHKVFIVDDRTVVTGSYNPTSSGTSRNRENVLIITDPAIAAQYRAEYELLRSQATTRNATK